MTDNSKRPIRWWPAALIVLAVVARWASLMLSPTDDQQARTFKIGGALAIGFLLLLLWAMFFSRLALRAKLGVLAGTVGAVVLFFTLFRIEEVSGNLVPILSFRWAGETELEAGGRSAAVTTTSNDFPQFLGPHRNGSAPLVGLARDWQATPPRELWRRPVGDGQSGFAVVGDAAVTFEQRGEEQVVVRYELKTGDVVWSHGLPGHFATVIGGNGPRSTPTVADDRVYAFGPLGGLRALSLAAGELVWKKDLAADLGVKPPEWGFASSPLVTEAAGRSLVMVSVGAPGASLVALDAESGEIVWSGGEDRVGYSSPILAELGGHPQILILNGASVAGHDPETGNLLWSYPWPGDQPNVAVPNLLGGDQVLVSSGYGIGASLLRISQEGSGLKAEQVWHSPRLKAKFTNPVVHGDRVYGLDDGVLTCLDPADGSRCWKKGRYGHGQSLLVDDLLLVQTEDGRVVLVEANPEEFRELGQIQALSDKSWNPPALAGRYLLVRNSKEAVCYELPTA